MLTGRRAFDGEDRRPTRLRRPSCVDEPDWRRCPRERAGPRPAGCCAGCLEKDRQAAVAQAIGDRADPARRRRAYRTAAQPIGASVVSRRHQRLGVDRQSPPSLQSWPAIRSPLRPSRGRCRSLRADCRAPRRRDAAGPDATRYRSRCRPTAGSSSSSPRAMSASRLWLRPLEQCRRRSRCRAPTARAIRSGHRTVALWASLLTAS